MSQINAGANYELLELVDCAGRSTGTARKLAAHGHPGQLHRAFSVFLFDADGLLILQRRALGKYHSPGVWSNSCCGHPRPGEHPAESARRRVVEELGVAPDLLAEAGTVVYRIQDPISGLTEHEFNHTFVGRLLEEPRPDPAEVAGTLAINPPELAEALARDQFSVWFEAVAAVALGGVSAHVPAARGWSWPLPAAVGGGEDR